jgi:hypothetical protein
VYTAVHTCSTARRPDRARTGPVAQPEELLPAEDFFSDLLLPEEEPDDAEESEPPDPEEEPESEDPEEEPESELEELDESPEDLASAAACLALLAERVP